MKKIKNQSGITLIELLIAVVIVAFLGGAVYSIFAQGLRVWRFSQKQTFDLNSEFFLEKLSFDLRNAIAYSGSSFSGGKDALEFYALTLPQEIGSAADMEVKLKFGIPVRVHYKYDRDRKWILRSHQLLLNAQNPETVQYDYYKDLMTDIESFDIEYYYYGQASGAYFWKDDWLEPGFPAAVRVRFECAGGLEGSGREVSQILSVPLGAYQGNSKV